MASAKKSVCSAERLMTLNQISEAALGQLRLREPGSLQKLERSLRRHGQLEPIVVFPHGELFEVVDGFKRLHAGRQLDWPELSVRVADIDSAQAKLLLLDLHSRRALSALEEAWLVRSLHREHGLTQGVIGQRLGRHKSWICRRLLLAEQVQDTVQASVRLGLLTPRAAVALAALRRRNQQAAADVVVERGLTARQTELLVAELIDCREEELEQRLREWARGKHTDAAKQPKKVRSEADWIAQDIALLRNVGARLEARLLSTPLAVHGEGTRDVIQRGLSGLLPALGALAATVERALGRGSNREGAA
jgi:ParB/RepB/Spo0J family partition protein